MRLILPNAECKESLKIAGLAIVLAVLEPSFWFKFVRVGPVLAIDLGVQDVAANGRLQK